MSQDMRSPSTTPAILDKQPQLPKRLSAKRLWFPLLLQTGLILAIPAQTLYTQLTGKTVIIQTVPVDPYDPLRGYSQTLSYDISRLDNLRQLPGWQELSTQQDRVNPNTLPNSQDLKVGTRFYVILEAPVSTESQPPKAWNPVRVSSSIPASLPAKQVAIQGKYTGNSIQYGLETYYMPESQRQEINQDIVQRGRQQQSIVVEAKVDAQGNAVPISFWVSDRNYHF